MEPLEPCKAMNQTWSAACRGNANTIGNQIANPVGASSLSHRASDESVLIIRDFHFELPGSSVYIR
jgi:hypothetical protein